MTKSRTHTHNQSTIALLVSVMLVAVCLVTPSAMAHPGSGIAVDTLGQVYFLDTGSGLWKIDRLGGLNQLSASKFHWLTLDSKSRFANTRLPSGAGPGQDWQILSVGVNPTVIISSDSPIAIGEDGNLYYQSASPSGLRIIRSSPSGMTSVAATLPLTASGQRLADVNGLTAGPSGSVYYTENNAIRRITARGIVGTVVTVPAVIGAPSMPGIDQHPYLRGLAVDAHGIMYVADTGDACVLKITPAGKITTLVKTQSPWAPTDVALFGNDVYVLEYLHTARDVRRDWLPRVRKVTSDGASTIIANIDQMPNAR